jgi:hypothetical protein
MEGAGIGSDRLFDWVLIVVIVWRMIQFPLVDVAVYLVVYNTPSPAIGGVYCIDHSSQGRPVVVRHHVLGCSYQNHTCWNDNSKYYR